MTHTIKILLILTTVLLSCSSKKKEDMTKSVKKFTWDVQFAGYDHNQSDQKGESNYQDFLKEFNSFPWIEQLEKAKRNPDKSAPTITVKNLETKKDFFISMAGDKDNHGYILGYIYPKEKKGLFGLGKVKTIRWLEMRTTEDKQTVENLITYFFEENYIEYEKEFRALEDFGQMQSQDLSN